MNRNRPLTGWRRTLHLKLRFGLSKLPVCPVRYRLRTEGEPDFFFRWTRVIPFMDPAKGAFDFELYGWDVRELRFLRRFLTPGMTFIDVGAHHGLYTILAAARVARGGRVVAFEPSPAIVRRLAWHVRINAARNVEICAQAVGAEPGTVPLFVPTRGVDTVASLRAASLGDARVRRVAVNVTTLDAAMMARSVRTIDLIKLDVEGAEADVLAGALRIRGQMSPLWLFEALDSTSAGWGWSGRRLVEQFARAGHDIFEFNEQGRLRPHAPREAYPHDSNCNLLAVPPAARTRVVHLIAP